MANLVLERLEASIAVLRQKMEHYRSLVEKCDQIEGEIITIETKIQSFLVAKENKKERILKTKTRSPTQKDVAELRKLNAVLRKHLEELDIKRKELREAKAAREMRERDAEALQNQIAEALKQSEQVSVQSEKGIL